MPDRACGCERQTAADQPERCGGKEQRPWHLDPDWQGLVDREKSPPAGSMAVADVVGHSAERPEGLKNAGERLAIGSRQRRCPLKTKPARGFPRAVRSVKRGDSSQKKNQAPNWKRKASASSTQSSPSSSSGCPQT